ncbi:hypothetical protein PPERSA_06310 [Pseudocohnilembus persalinus]|uniref:Uncharacterized protein n=1 Tax=Pseudocohnilembus persalinus TaxID=266149 RepID=A0A0V0QIH5_PSEPJ|nr:hypothetical protein PPERSA_06310 [Pseudocohnilembus persalinus]|eukprot:KRX02115.1 hypothetical protein PPERSA_06310 [Pseudocohnilembus persalinus]
MQFLWCNLLCYLIIIAYPRKQGKYFSKKKHPALLKLQKLADWMSIPFSVIQSQQMCGSLPSLARDQKRTQHSQKHFKKKFESDSEDYSDENSTLDYQKSRNQKFQVNSPSTFQLQKDQESSTDNDDSIPFSMLVNGHSNSNECPADGYENQGADLLSKKMKTGPNSFSLSFQQNQENFSKKSSKTKTKQLQKTNENLTKIYENSRKSSLSPQQSQTTRSPSLDCKIDKNNLDYIDLNDTESDEFDFTHLIRKSHNLQSQAHSYLEQSTQNNKGSQNEAFSSYLMDSDKEVSKKQDFTKEIIQILKEKKASLVEKNEPIYQQQQQFQVQCQFGHKFLTSYKLLKFTGRKNAGHLIEFDEIDEKNNNNNSNNFKINGDREFKQENIKKSLFQEESDFSCSDMEEEEKQQMMEQKPSFYFVNKKKDLCELCNKKYNEAQEYAQKKQGMLISQNLEQKIHFKCKRGHDFYLNIKDFSKKWCMKCKKLYKQEIKDFLKQEEKKQQQEYQEQQEELYRKARENYQKQKEEDSKNEQQQEEQKIQYNSVKIKQAQQELDIQLENVARNRADSFFKNNQKQKPEYHEISEQQAVQVYKMILYPENVLSCYLQVLNLSELKDFYKKNAQMLHPEGSTAVQNQAETLGFLGKIGNSQGILDFFSKFPGSFFFFSWKSSGYSSWFSVLLVSFFWLKKSLLMEKRYPCFERITEKRSLENQQNFFIIQRNDAITDVL